MPKVNVYDMAGKVVSEMELSEAVFGIEQIGRASCRERVYVLV